MAKHERPIGEKAEKTVDLKKISAIMQKNFIVLIRDKTRIIPLLLFPIFMILVYGFTSGNIPKHIPTAVVSYESSPLATQVLQEVQNSEVFSVKYSVSTEDEAKRLLDSGKVRVVIIIPSGLQEEYNNARQTGITIMVDESDSAIAAAAHQTLAGITTRLSTQLANDRLAQLQRDIDSASATLAICYTTQQNDYGIIAQKTQRAQESILQSQKIIDANARAALLTTGQSTIYVSPIHGDHANLSGNNTYVADSPADAAAKAQATTLQRSSAMLSVANQNLEAINAIASNANTRMEQQQSVEQQEQNVQAPLREIRVFTKSTPNGLISPISYNEKPAYGTGKRAIDFLIPTIIALTVFQGAVMGMGRAVAGEKREGSLTRVFLTPTSNTTIISGTLLFYIVFELCRAAFLIGISILIFNIKIEGSFALIALILIIYIAISTAIGMILSSLVKTEPQYMAIAMLVSMPTMFLAGVFFPLQAMPKVFQTMASFLPVTYAGQALRDVMIKGFGIEYIVYPLTILIVFLVVMLTLLAMAFKRNIE